MLTIPPYAVVRLTWEAEPCAPPLNETSFLECLLACVKQNSAILINVHSQAEVDSVANGL